MNINSLSCHVKAKYLQDWLEIARNFPALAGPDCRTHLRNVLLVLWAWMMLAAFLSPVSASAFSGPAALRAASQPPACQRIGQAWVSSADGMTLLCVPGGEFLMGSILNDLQAESDEKPLRRVKIEAFWIDRTEVTNAMFARCIAAGACHERKYAPYQWGVWSRTRDPYFTSLQYRNYPVIMLDVDEAARYCAWADRRLPDEAEWEKAARGTDGRRYPWGQDLDCQHANYEGCHRDTERVGAYPLGASPYGVLDMAGNLWEWTASLYDREFHTLRGGGWGSYAVSLRTANRSTGKPEHWSDGQIGFRCAK